MPTTDMSLSEARKRFEIVEPNVKLQAGITPFLTFPLLKACNFRCCYCGEGGELTASMESQWDHGQLLARVWIAHRLGVRKFRLTGGEPFLYKHIVPVLEAFSGIGCYTHINTNGSLVESHESIIAGLNANMHFAVSLDTLSADRFKSMTQTQKRFDYYHRTLAGIKTLAKHGRLLRINMVVTTANVDEISDMIDFCAETGCNLKLLDVVSVPLPYGDRRSLHVSLNEIEERLAAVAHHVDNHEYARAFGTPCKIYVCRGVRVTVKNTWNGSRYDVKGICQGCEYFPCHEGLYDVFALPDGRVVGCRWSDTSVAATNAQHDRYAAETDFEEALGYMFAVFRRATYLPREDNPMMRPRPHFVLHSLGLAEST